MQSSSLTDKSKEPDQPGGINKTIEDLSFVLNHPGNERRLKRIFCCERKRDGEGEGGGKGEAEGDGEDEDEDEGEAESAAPDVSENANGATVAAIGVVDRNALETRSEISCS
jgi:hypothetical protein